MSTLSPTRSPYWDVVKGLGIVAIVLGHSCYYKDAIAFVYLFHLALFFFVSGYLYHEKKYGDTPFSFFAARLSGSWGRYVFYTSLFVLAHNFFITRGLYAGQELYNHTKMLTAICSNIAFAGAEPVSGALWFVPVWLVASGLFAGTVWFGRKASEILKKPELKLIWTALANLFVGLVGVFLFSRKSGIMWNLQTSFLVVPIYFFAYLLKIGLPDFKKYTPWYGCVIAAVLLRLINSRLHIYFDLASMAIPGVWFFPISLIGIYFALSLAALLEKCRPICQFLALLGKHSFDIMAVHFAVFKLLDLIYARLVLKAIPENLPAFPVSFAKELWIFYLIFGLLVPLGCGLLLDQAETFFNRSSSSHP